MTKNEKAVKAQEEEVVTFENFDQPKIETKAEIQPEPEKQPEEVQSEPKAPPAPLKRIGVKAQMGGMLVGTNIDEQYRLAVAYSKSRMLPASYDTPEKILTGMQFAYELGLKPLNALRQIAIINGTPSLFGDLPLAVVRNSKFLRRIKEFMIDAQGNPIDFRKTPNAEPAAAVCQVQRFDGEPREFVYSVKDAKEAGLWGTKVWKVHPKRMLQLRARNWLLKDEFGDVLAGCSIAEYDYNVAPETAEKEVKCEVEPSAQNLNDLFGKKVENVAPKAV